MLCMYTQPTDTHHHKSHRLRVQFIHESIGSSVVESRTNAFSESQHGTDKKKRPPRGKVDGSPVCQRTNSKKKVAGNVSGN